MGITRLMRKRWVNRKCQSEDDMIPPYPEKYGLEGDSIRGAKDGSVYRNSFIPDAEAILHRGHHT